MKNKLLFFIIVFQVKLLQAVGVRIPIFWERSFSLNVTNPNAYGSLIQSTSFIVASQDFQSLNALSDYRATPERVVFNFGECCLASNTTLASLQEMNHHSVIVQALENAQNMALVKRGNCKWSEKISVVNNLSLQNNLNITAIMIYDNNNDPNVQIASSATSGFGSASPLDFSVQLPSSRNILNFTDNDLRSSNDRIVYFVPYKYGQTFLNRINAMYNASNPSMRDYWLITPYFDQVTWGVSTADTFFATGKGYLSYVIALAAIFIIAIIFVRWWKIRRARLYGAPMTDSNGFPMQPRMSQLDPLPVDIVNKLPIDLYSQDKVKNENCAVCLEDFVPEKSDVRILPCGHGFCVLCIDPWLTQKSSLCPFCKYDCLPSDLRTERENLTQQQQHPDTLPPPMIDAPTSHETTPATTHSTIPPTPTAVPSPPVSPPPSLHKKNSFTDTEFNLAPSTSAQATHDGDNSPPPEFTTIDLSSEEKNLDNPQHRH